MEIKRFVIWLGGLGVIISLLACHSQPPLPEQRFDLRGKVVAIAKSAGTVRLQHEAIPGYMAAMTMDYPVKDKWVFDILKTGETLRATLVVASDRAWLEGIVITDEAKPDAKSPEASESAPSAVGKEVPDFPLVNQDGKRIHLQQYRGKALLLTFIYTRCPLPNYCPLMSKNLAKILEQTEADPKLSTPVHLLSISIDPEYDKPAVLRSYGQACTGGSHLFDRWEFASGTPEQVRKVAEFFGLKYWNEGGQIVHALVTALIDPNGKVARVYRGNEWQPAEVINDVQSVTAARSPRG